MPSQQTQKPDAPSCLRNRDPILAVLCDYLGNAQSVLEIGSGTGQHAIYFAAALPHLQWQCSDREPYLAGISAWLNDAALPNTPAPLKLDVSQPWPALQVDAVFSANTLHIMAWSEVEQLFAHLPMTLKPEAHVIIYGPFNYAGQFTSPSNAAFDTMLKAHHPQRGIRDFEAVNALAEQADLKLCADIAMPSNNRCLVWQNA